MKREWWSCLQGIIKPGTRLEWEKLNKHGRSSPGRCQLSSNTNRLSILSEFRGRLEVVKNAPCATVHNHCTTLNLLIALSM